MTLVVIRNRWTLAVASLIFAINLSSAIAGSVTYITPSGSSTTDGVVDANATLTAGAGFVQVTLTNLEQNQNADGQLISGLTFDVSGVTGTGSLTTVNTGEITSINSNGSYTPTGTDPLTRWDASKTSGLVDITTLSGGQPNLLIIGPDSAGGFTGAGTYSVNSSVKNPVVLGSATFDITIAGVTASSTFSNVTFQFGTTAGSKTVAGQLAPSVPEPSAIIMVLSAIPAGFVVYLRRRRRRVN